jgi:NAD(P)H-dependent flavin oxidoreductase YrpB (nitropropane dioxygenase family)
MTGFRPIVPQVVDAVGVPVVAAGGIADGRAIAAAFALGAAGVQLGTAYLLCPETATPPLHREALRQARGNATVVTNVFSGRPARVLVNRFARELGPLSDAAPDFPLPLGELLPLRAKAEQQGSSDSRRSGRARARPLRARCWPRRRRWRWLRGQPNASTNFTARTASTSSRNGCRSLGNARFFLLGS